MDHSQPAHFAQPTLRRFERKPIDDLRRHRWEAYTQELDALWKEYRAEGSTPAAWQFYKQAAADAKARYVYGDPYLAPVLPVPFLPGTLVPGPVLPGPVLPGPVLPGPCCW